jgi:hypothetical protein
MKLKYFIPGILVVLALASCKTVSYMQVDLSDPPVEPLPENIQSLTLVNRAVDKRFTDDPSDSVQRRFFESRFNLDTVIFDIKASDTLMQALGNLLYESSRFDIVIPEDRFLLKDTINLYADSMKWDQVADITRRFNTDGVLSLDYCKTGISAFFGKKIYNNWSGDLEFYYASMDINYSVIFRLYHPGSENAIYSYFLSDTLHWEDEDLGIRPLFRRLTTVKNGLSETGIAAAMNLSKRIAPVWNSYRRAYFGKGNKLLKQTTPMVLNNDWKTSVQIWKDAYNKVRTRSLRSKLEFNFALAAEMQGNLDEAIRWGVKSHQTFFRPVTYDYMNKLKARQEIFNKTDENEE